MKATEQDFHVYYAVQCGLITVTAVDGILYCAWNVIIRSESDKTVLSSGTAYCAMQDRSSLFWKKSSLESYLFNENTKQ